MLKLVAALLIVIGVAGAQAGVISPQSGWYAGNPLLGPATLTGVACAESTCYAAGNAGTLLRSADGGASWIGLATGVQQDLHLLRLIGGSPDSVVVGGDCVMRRSDDGGKTFSRLPFTARDLGCPIHVSTAAFPSSSVGYLVLESGAVLSTADGGRTFSRRTAVPAGTANDLVCTSNATCVAVTTAGTIQRTTDGAVSWTEVFPNSGVQLRGIASATPTVMYAVGDGLTLIESVDGGATWQPRSISGVPGSDLGSIRCADPDNCLITATNGSQLIRMSGDTFASIVASSDPTYAADFASASRAVAAGAAGSAEISDDGGANWKAVGSRIEGQFQVLQAATGSVAYAGGLQGVLARTVNGGQSWANISPPTSADIVAVAAPSPETVFVLAADGSLQRSDNGGASYKILSTGASTVPSAVVALDSQRILLLGPHGIRRSGNGGSSFEAVEDGVARQAVVSTAARVGTFVFAFGGHELVVSADGGQRWRKLKTPPKRTIRAVSFGSQQVGFLLDTRGSLWRTQNAGRSWKELETLGCCATYLRFSDARHGFALAGPDVLRTEDGGKTWHPQYLIGTRIAALDASGGTAYALVGASVLYATTSGGDAGEPQRLSLRAKPSALKKPGVVTIGGRLSPAQGGEDVLVYRHVASSWSLKHAVVASNGVFSTRWGVAKRSAFVAQIFGDAGHAGAGTGALTVKVGR